FLSLLIVISWGGHWALSLRYRRVPAERCFLQAADGFLRAALARLQRPHGLPADSASMREQAFQALANVLPSSPGGHPWPFETHAILYRESCQFQGAFWDQTQGGLS